MAAGSRGMIERGGLRPKGYFPPPPGGGGGQGGEGAVQNFVEESVDSAEATLRQGG